MKRQLSILKSNLEAGAILVELAGVSIFLLTMLAGTINIGGAIRASSILVEATRVAGRTVGGVPDTGATGDTLCVTATNTARSFLVAAGLNASNYTIGIESVDLNSPVVFSAAGRVEAVKISIDRISGNAPYFGDLFSTSEKAASIFYLESQVAISNSC